MTKQRIFKILKWFFGITISLSLLITGGIYYFKDDLIAIVLTKVNSHLKAPVKVAKIDIAFWSSFPDVSVDFDHVFIRDTYEDAKDTDTLFYTDKLRLRFNPFDLWKEEYKVKQVDLHPGTLQLKVNKEGVNNYDILKETGDTTQTDMTFDVEKVHIKNLRFAYDDKKVNQRYATDLLETELEGRFAEQVFTVHAKIHSIVNETRSGQVNFVSNKVADLDINVEIDQNKGTVTIPATIIHISNLPFSFRGFIGPDEMDFAIEAKKLSLTDVANNLALQEVEHVKKFSGSGTVNFKLEILQKPATKDLIAIDCAFGVANGRLTEPATNIQITNLSLQGLYSNNKGKGNAFLALNNIHLETKTGPFEGAIKLSEFDAPRVQGLANGNLNLEAVHLLYPLPEVEKIGGNVKINAEFNAKIHPSGQIDIAKCEGSVELVEDYIQLINDRRVFQSINGLVYLKNNDVGINNFALKIGQSDMALTGFFSNIIGFYNHSGKLNADVSVTSNQIKLEDLATSSKEENVQTNAPRSYVLPQNITGNLNLAISNLSYANHVFSQIQGNLNLSDQRLQFNNIRFKTSGANIAGNVSIKETSPEYFITTSNLTSSNIQLKQLMKDWNNFSQDVIKDENIFGQAAVNLFLEAPFDLRTGINMKAIKSDVYLKIENGRLKGVKAFQEIVQNINTPATKVILGSSNIKALGEKLTDLKFETMENTFIIRNGVVEIPEMKINSSLLNVEAKGTHTFENAIDYRFSFRLRDLKQQQRNSEFGEIIDDNTGLRIYMRMYGTIDNPQFAWDQESKSEVRKEYNEQEKQNVKSMLKSEFGLFKKDSTVNKFESTPVKPKEVLEVQYGTDTKDTEDFETTKKKKDGKINSFLKKMEEEEQKRKKVEVEFD